MANSVDTSNARRIGLGAHSLRLALMVDNSSSHGNLRTAAVEDVGTSSALWRTRRDPIKSYTTLAARWS